MARPKVYDEGLRARLLEGAAEQIARGGVEGLALRALAEAQGTSTNAVYAMFGGKPGLVAAVLARASESFTAAQRTAVPAGDLAELGRAYRAWALAHPAWYAVMFSDRGLAAHPGGVEGQPDPGRKPLEELVARGISEGRMRGPAEVAVLCIWASVHGLVSLELGQLCGLTREVRDAVYEAQLEAVHRAWTRD